MTAVGVIPAEAERRPPIVVVGCGARKLACAAPAAELYVGPYFTSCLAAALAIAAYTDIRILSALYGLVHLDRVLVPYNVTLGDPGAITPRELLDQARDQELLDRRAVALCGSGYVRLLEPIWGDELETPLAHQGIGRQRATLAQIAIQGRLS